MRERWMRRTENVMSPPLSTIRIWVCGQSGSPRNMRGPPRSGQTVALCSNRALQVAAPTLSRLLRIDLASAMRTDSAPHSVWHHASGNALEGNHESSCDRRRHRDRR
jgi:hypothetical protein